MYLGHSSNTVVSVESALPSQEYALARAVLTDFTAKKKVVVESKTHVNIDYHWSDDVTFRISNTDNAFPILEVTDEVATWVTGITFCFNSIIIILKCILLIDITIY